MKNFIQEGQMMTVPAPYTVSSGDGVKVGSLFGVAAYNAAAGQSLEIATGGVFDLPKAPGDTPAWGGKIYWDDAAKVVTTSSAGNAFIGVAAQPATGTALVARTRLNGFAQ